MANVKGFISKAEKNKFGYWAISVGTGKGSDGKTTWANISFKEKGDTLLINGVEPKKGMLIDAEVEGQYNNFVSGTVKDAPKAGGSYGGGKAPFEKKEYDQTGNAVGGAVNRANELLAAGRIKAEEVPTASLAQYYISEYLIKAVKAGPEGIKAYHTAFKGVNVLDITAVVKAKNALEEALKAIAPAPAAPVAPAEQKAPVAPVKQPEPAVVVEEPASSPFEDGFDDTPDF